MEPFANMLATHLKGGETQPPQSPPTQSLWSRIKWWSLFVCVCVTLGVVVYVIYRIYTYFHPSVSESFTPKKLHHSSRFVDPDDVNVPPNGDE